MNLRVFYLTRRGISDGYGKSVNKDLFCGILYRKRLCFCWCVAAWVKQKMVL